MEYSSSEIKHATSMSFLRLIDNHIINVPVIQRDYVQGRETDVVTEIRKQFVKDLLFYISDNSQSHNIDYVYGTVEYSNTEESKIFIPLDGQQRLTTLFLLHLYIAGMSNNYDTFKERIKGKFRYSTRKSSSEFCKGLISSNVWSELLIIKRNSESGTDIKPSRIIENQGWFFQAWKQDPTVAGMLVMLNEIDDQVNSESKIKKGISYEESFSEYINNLYIRLFSSEKEPIIFQWQPLDGYTRTDDLYIKMNARGLKLTDFEIFKALYEKSLNHSPSFKKCFEENIDGCWSDFLWRYEQTNTDAVLERIIRLMIGCGYCTEVAKPSKVILDKIFCFNKQDIIFAYSRFSDLEILHDIHLKENQISDNIKRIEVNIANHIIDAMSALCGEDSPLIKEESLCLPWYDERNEISYVLHENLSNIEYDQLVFFYAYIRFMAQYKGDLKTELPQWIRLIHNLVNATNINESTDMSEMFNSIERILKDIHDNPIIDWLCTKPVINKFSQNQVFEEYVKANLIKWGRDNNEVRWNRLIRENETDEYMDGQIGFLLVISGVYLNEFDSFNKEDSDKALKILDQASKNSRRIFSHFKRNFTDKLVEDHLLEQTMLINGMYLRHNTSSRLNFCNRPFDRDNSWKKLLEVPFKEKNNEGIKAFKQIITAKWSNENDAIESLQNMYDTYRQNHTHSDEWYAPFLGPYGKQLIDICSQGFIHKNNGHITLLHQSQMNHYHSELLSRELFFELKSEYEEYDFIHYASVRSGEENPGIYFEILICSIPVTIFIYHKRGWRLEIYDKSMLNKFSNTENWPKCEVELREILGKPVEDIKEYVPIDKQYIRDLLSRVNSNK